MNEYQAVHALDVILHDEIVGCGRLLVGTVRGDRENFYGIVVPLTLADGPQHKVRCNNQLKVEIECSDFLQHNYGTQSLADGQETV